VDLHRHVPLDVFIGKVLDRGEASDGGFRVGVSLLSDEPEGGFRGEPDERDEEGRPDPLDAEGDFEGCESELSAVRCNG
jgi:hypothetical protein